jgi:hypothetical protein
MLRNVQEFSRRKQRDRVVAELTFRHLIEAGREAGQFISDEEALEFLNQDGHADQMWIRMMRAGEDYAMSKLREASVRPSTQAWALAHRRYCYTLRMSRPPAIRPMVLLWTPSRLTEK